MGPISRRDAQDGAGSQPWRTIASPEVTKCVNDQFLASLDARSVGTEGEWGKYYESPSIIFNNDLQATFRCLR